MTSHINQRDEWRAQLKAFVQQAKENNDSDVHGLIP
jgi:hypothetical protein